MTAFRISPAVADRTTTEKAGKILTVDTERARSARVMRLFGLTPPRGSARTA
ncbi:hypothetical protein OG939_35625 [Streptomyces sp. NBC_01685]|uniref:hypothetical protein n=1 Tax=Streptomyces sp. NBC_01685 TaxID=2975910 RepID=UPI002E35BFB0|nr:hypothetical protein [Streptomyces sp. NBC_01685]